MATDFSGKCEILADLWTEYRNDEQFYALIQFADLGMPLAYLIHEGIVERTDQTEDYVNQAWDLLLQILEIKDTGFDTLLQVTEQAKEKVA